MIYRVNEGDYCRQGFNFVRGRGTLVVALGRLRVMFHAKFRWDIVPKNWELF